MKRYHTVAFDLDGTLTDPKRGLTQGFAYGLKKVGVKFGSVEELKKFIGPPLRESFKREYDLSEKEADDALYLFREYFGVYGWWDNELYPGIHELLASLRERGFKIVLATSKPEVYSSKILKLFGLLEYFDFAEGASFDSSRERKRDVLDYALSKVGVISDEDRRGAILVGDTVYDVEGANELGIDSLAVTYGYGTREALAKEGATYIVDRVEEIKNIILGD
ncbi:MAG: HAD hydrolase-like protein [Clostridia bacterium]|nr:HAD hydrolase-like protein [Clostridia bacterium]